MRVHPALDDEEIARALQEHEIAQSHLARQRWVSYEIAQNQLQGHQLGSYVESWHPIWGELRCKTGEPVRFKQRLIFHCCPCIFIHLRSSGTTTEQVRRSWRAFFVSWSIFFALVQLTMLLVSVGLHGGFAPLSSNAMLGPDSAILDQMGAKNTARILHCQEWWRLVTPQLLHAGWFHYLTNLTVLLSTGVTLEVLWGHVHWMLIYNISGVFGTLVSSAALPDKLMVGASGALCGLIGAWLAFIAITWNQTLPADVKARNSQMCSVLVSILIIIASSNIPLMDAAAHLGGLIMGMALAAILFASRLQHHMWRILTRIIGIGVFTWVIIAAGCWLHSARDVRKPKEC